MYLKLIKLFNFKNHIEFYQSFDKKYNLLIGKNGSGKTAILDAIYYLSYTKSFINSSDNQNVNFNQNEFSIFGQFHKSEVNYDIIINFAKDKSKKIYHNKKKIDRISNHIGLFFAVESSPNDILILYEGSSERRKFIDSIISLYDNKYLEKLLKYNKIIAQRNMLLKHSLKEKTIVDNITLNVYNNYLINFGSYIYDKRKEFFNEFENYFIQTYQKIAGNTDYVNLNYHSKLHNIDYNTLIADSLQVDKYSGITTEGIHKDDLELLIKGKNIKKIASQGQQKTYLLSLKLAKYFFIKNKTNFKPILLIDDLFDKLDNIRAHNILNLIFDENNFGQIFISDTNIDNLIKCVDDNKFDNFNVINLD